MFRLAICNELYRDWPWQRALDHARQCGYQGIEIAPHTLGPVESRFSTGRVRALRKAADDQGLAIVGLHWLLAGTSGLHWTSRDEITRTKTIDYFRRLIALCHEFGGKVMVLGSPQQRKIPADSSRNDALHDASVVIDTLLPDLADAQITLAVEPLGKEETDFLNTADDVATFIQPFNSPWVRLHLDVKAMATETSPIPQIIERHGNILAHFHANDPNRKGPGMGAVNFAPILRALRGVRYNGWISVEVFDETPGIEALASESIQYLKRTMAELSG
jgi:sugar phosphate isomerase/epimerase